MDFLLAGNRFSLTGKGLLPGVDVQRRYLWKTFRPEAEQRSGVGQKAFGFSPEFVFAFNPEWCSESARNPVRLHPGMVFAFPRNTQYCGCFIPALTEIRAFHAVITHPMRRDRFKICLLCTAFVIY